MNELICGDNIEVLKKYPDNHFDSVCTDPPYGLGDEPDATEMLKAWLDHGYLEVKGSGFMGRAWDAFVPQPLFWKEVFRVLKPGGHVLAFYGTRTFDWGVMAMRLAGFEIRDQISWIYGQGFPKSHNVSKAIDAQADEAEREEEAKQWGGWGSALKPATEPIILARKPLEKGLSIADNVIKWGTGAINIDVCRIKHVTIGDGNLALNPHLRDHINCGNGGHVIATETERRVNKPNAEGRFPANVILSHHPECQCMGLKKVRSTSAFSGGGEGGIWKKGNGVPVSDGHGDENGEETLEEWKCHPECPVKIMDDQSGMLKSGKPAGNKNIGGGYHGNFGSIPVTGYGDEGYASRFFYVAKATKVERNWGLDDFEDKEMVRSIGAQNENEYPKEQIGLNKTNIVKNVHPTIKPVSLMRYLVRMITRPGGMVLDPFNGSGTTGIACKLEGFDYTGIDREQEYIDISRGRIDNWVDELEVMVERKIKESKKDKSQLGFQFE